MNQTEQVTGITGSDIDAAVQDERMIKLERQINNLYAEAARQAERIEKLEMALGPWLEEMAVIVAERDDLLMPE